MAIKTLWKRDNCNIPEKSNEEILLEVLLYLSFILQTQNFYSESSQSYHVWEEEESKGIVNEMVEILGPFKTTEKQSLLSTGLSFAF